MSRLAKRKGDEKWERTIWDYQALDRFLTVWPSIMTQVNGMAMSGNKTQRDLNCNLYRISAAIWRWQATWLVHEVATKVCLLVCVTAQLVYEWTEQNTRIQNEAKWETTSEQLFYPSRNWKPWAGNRKSGNKLNSAYKIPSSLSFYTVQDGPRFTWWQGNRRTYWKTHTLYVYSAQLRAPTSDESET